MFWFRMGKCADINGGNGHVLCPFPLIFGKHSMKSPLWRCVQNKSRLYLEPKHHSLISQAGVSSVFPKSPFSSRHWFGWASCWDLFNTELSEVPGAFGAYGDSHNPGPLRSRIGVFRDGLPPKRLTPKLQGGLRPPKDLKGNIYLGSFFCVIAFLHGERWHLTYWLTVSELIGSWPWKVEWDPPG